MSYSWLNLAQTQSEANEMFVRMEKLYLLIKLKKKSIAKKSEEKKFFACWTRLSITLTVIHITYRAPLTRRNIEQARTITNQWGKTCL